MIALYLTLRNVFLVRLAIPCVILCEICFCPVCLFCSFITFLYFYMYCFYANKLHYNQVIVTSDLYNCASSRHVEIIVRDISVSSVKTVELFTHQSECISSLRPRDFDL